MQATAQSVLVGRQTIYDAKLEIAAYELLYRSGGPPTRGIAVDGGSAVFDDGDRATTELLVNALLEIGLDQLTGDHPGFVNFTRGLLVGDWDLPFDPARLVIEVLEDVPPDDDVRAALTRLREAGYRIALDDVVDDDDRILLLDLADFVKVDLMGSDPKRLPQQVRRLKRDGVQLLAEKVETLEEFERCRDLGFELFQGYFLSRPRIVEGRKLEGNKLAVLNLLSRLQDPTVAFDEVVTLLKQDVVLSVQLLRYVNSSALALRRSVESVQQAATLLGLNTIRQIVSLIVVSGLGDKPAGLVDETLVRARFCECLARRMGLANPEACFTVGLFSNLDALMDHPLPELLASLPLADDLRAALLTHEGELGRLLSHALAFERGEWDCIDGPALSDAMLQSAYVEAVDRTNQSRLADRN